MELRLRDGEWPALGHTVRKGQGWNVNPRMPGCSSYPVMVVVGSGWKSLREGSGGGVGAVPEQREDMESGAPRRQAWWSGQDSSQLKKCTVGAIEW